MKKPLPIYRRPASILVLALIVALQACTVVAVRTAVKVVKNKRTEKASAEVAATPDQIFQAEEAALNARPDAFILSRNPQAHTIEAQVGDDRIRTRVVPLGDGRSEFVTEAISEDDLGPDENPAVQFERSVLDQLGIDYQVVYGQ